MDLLTDLQILQDLLDASSRRGVAVYVVLEARGVPHFLDMCSRLQINAMHLRVSKQSAAERRFSNTVNKEEMNMGKQLSRSLLSPGTMPMTAGIIPD